MSGSETEGRWPTGGRTLRWRLGMIMGGLALCAYAVGLSWWPPLLAWTTAVVVGGLGVVCVASAFLARGRP